MIAEFVQNIFDWVSLHPHWSGFIVFAIAFAESLLVVGLFIPGVALMTGIGTLIGAGYLNLSYALIAAILGAIAGDGLSYWIGWRYKESLREIWPLNKYPNLVERGEAFFKIHGGKSIFLGRFVGPVRAIIPTIAGMLNMKPLRFVITNFLSALAWAPAYLLPGIIVGSSFGYLPQGAGKKLALVLIILLLLIWIIAKTYHFIYSLISRVCRGFFKWLWRATDTPKLNALRKFLHHAHRPHGQTGNFVAIILLAILFISYTYSVYNHGWAVHWDLKVHQIFRALYNPWVAKFAVFVSTGFDTIVFIFCYFVLLMWLLAKKEMWAFAHAFGLFAISSVFLVLFKIGFPLDRPQDMLLVSSTGAFPSGHVARAFSLWGLISILATRHLNHKLRWASYFGVVGIVLIVAWSRLYLGLHWFSDIIGAIIFSWLSILVMVFSYQRRSHRISHSYILVLTIIVLNILLATLMMNRHRNIILWQDRRIFSTQNLTESQWWSDNSRNLPIFRTDLFGHPQPLLNLQWAVPLEEIEQYLKENGWQATPEFNLHNSLKLLQTKPSALNLPLLPAFHDQRLAVLTYAKPMYNNNRILVLSLWNSGYALSGSNQIIWIGTIEYRKPKNYLDFITLVLHWPRGEFFNTDSILNKIVQNKYMTKIIVRPIVVQDQNKSRGKIDENEARVLLIKSKD